MVSIRAFKFYLQSSLLAVLSTKHAVCVSLPTNKRFNGRTISVDVSKMSIVDQLQRRETAAYCGN